MGSEVEIFIGVGMNSSLRKDFCHQERNFVVIFNFICELDARFMVFTDGGTRHQHTFSRTMEGCEKMIMLFVHYLP